MSEVKAFNVDESAAISAAKETLQKAVMAGSVYRFSFYNFLTDTYHTDAIMTPEENTLMVVAGGVIPSILLKEQINDIDVFILKKNIELFRKLIDFKPGNWTIRYFFDEDNDTRSDDYKNPHVFATATNKETKVQYILTDHVDRKSLLSDFDYLHSTASYHEGSLYINRETYDAIMNKKLIRQHKNKKIRAGRANKFISRGWQSEEDALLNSPIKSLKDILTDQLHNLRTPASNPVTKKELDDGWQQAAATTGWQKRYENLLADALKKGNTSYGTDITLDDLLDDPYAEILKKPK
jgi:hypothetical protein